MEREAPTVKPFYGQLPVYHPSLRTYLAVGTYVKIQQKNDILVARILSHKLHCDGVPHVMLHLFPQVTESRHDDTIPFQQVYFTSQTAEIPIASVVELCWIFSKVEVDDLNNTLGHGSRHIYVVTYFENGSEYKIESDESNLLLPFPDLSKEYPLRDRSYSLTVFSDLQRILDEADKILNRSADTNRGTGSTFIHPVTLDFLDRNTQQHTNLISRTTFRKRTDSGVITRVRRKQNVWKVFRFQTVAELRKLFSIFGPTIVVGNRTRRPPVNQPFSPSAGSTQRVVVPSNSDEVFTFHSGKSGIDLATDGYSIRLYIRYREANIVRDRGNGKNDTEFLEKTYIHQLVEPPLDNDDESIDDRLT